MEQITLEQYKKYLVSRYNWECDNTEQGRLKRMSLLNDVASCECSVMFDSLRPYGV